MMGNESTGGKTRERAMHANHEPRRLIQGISNARQRGIQALALGASAGGSQALRILLQSLPATYECPIVITQHIAPGGDSALALQLDREFSLSVQEGRHGTPLMPGHVYLAPSGYHMLVESDRRLSLSVDALVHFSRPSIDELFRTAASVFRDKLLAVLLTGANADGARGLAKAYDSGALTVVQDPKEAEYPTMPREAQAYLQQTHRGATHREGSLEAIADLLLRCGSRNNPTDLSESAP